MRFLRRQRCGGERRGNEQQRQPHDTSSVTVLSVRESGPTMMSNAPGSTPPFLSMFHSESERGVSVKLIASFSPGAIVPRRKPFHSFICCLHTVTFSQIDRNIGAAGQ